MAFVEHQRMNYDEYIAERTNIAKDIVADYYRKLDDGIIAVGCSKPVLYQGYPGYDVHEHIKDKYTFLITGHKNFIKLHDDGLCLWRYNKDEQSAQIDNHKEDWDLIEKLRKPLDLGLTKYYQDISDEPELPCENYTLLCLQELLCLRPGDKYFGLKLCKILAEEATAENPLIIKPHPFVTWENTKPLNRLAKMPYVFVSTEYKPTTLIKNAKKVVGNSSSLLVDAMVYQKEVMSYCELSDFSGGLGSIKRQNQWLSWYHKERCVDVDNNLEQQLEERFWKT